MIDAAHVADLIARRGTLIGYLPLKGTVYDPATSRVTATTGTPLARRAVVEPLGEGVNMTYTGRQRADGGAQLSLSALLRLTLDAAVTPALGDLFTVSGTTYAVTWMRPTYSGDAIVLWTVDGEAR